MNITAIATTTTSFSTCQSQWIGLFSAIFVFIVSEVLPFIPSQYTKAGGIVQLILQLFKSFATKMATPTTATTAPSLKAIV